MKHVTVLGLQGFTLFKIVVYSALCYSGGSFIYEDIIAAQLLLSDSSSIAEVLNIFSVTIDTVAWMILLLIFELETSVLEDEVLQGKLKWVLSGISAFCYLVIIYALTGYVGKLIMLNDGAVFVVNNICDLVNGTTVLMIDMDEYGALTQENCTSLLGVEMGRINNFPIVYEQSIYEKILGLATVASVNSAAWILVVLILQFDIVMQLKGQLNKHIMRVSGVIKALLYSVLLFVAGYWGVEGDFIDFLDAFLWLSGFFIIELNVLNWNKDSDRDLTSQTAA